MVSKELRTCEDFMMIKRWNDDFVNNDPDNGDDDEYGDDHE